MSGATFKRLSSECCKITKNNFTPLDITIFNAKLGKFSLLYYCLPFLIFRNALINRIAAIGLCPFGDADENARHHENLQTKQTAKDTHEARVFCRLLLEERLLKSPSGMKA